MIKVLDHVSCVSLANVDFLLKNKPEISVDCVEGCSNNIEPLDMSACSEERIAMRRKYGIPQDKIVFLYGGNLGKPQGIPFLIDCIRSRKNNPNVFFLIVGSKTVYGKLEKFQNDEHQENFKVLSALPKDDHDRMAGSCDVGMIFKVCLEDFSVDLAQMGSCGYRYLKEHYTVTEAYKIIVKSVNG